MIKFNHRGEFEKTFEFLERMKRKEQYRMLDSYARMGLDALVANTPVDSGRTRDSWSYEIHISKNTVKIQWNNSNINEGLPVAILVQYGHAGPNGHWVEGNDFINPALAPVFDNIAEEVWREVTE